MICMGLCFWMSTWPSSHSTCFWGLLHALWNIFLNKRVRSWKQLGVSNRCKVMPLWGQVFAMNEQGGSSVSGHGVAQLKFVWMSTQVLNGDVTRGLKSWPMVQCVLRITLKLLNSSPLCYRLIQRTLWTFWSSRAEHERWQNCGKMHWGMPTRYTLCTLIMKTIHDKAHRWSHLAHCLIEGTSRGMWHYMAQNVMQKLFQHLIKCYQLLQYRWTPILFPLCTTRTQPSYQSSRKSGMVLH